MDMLTELLAGLKGANPLLLLVGVVLAFIWLFDRFSARLLAMVERMTAGRKR